MLPKQTQTLTHKKRSDSSSLTGRLKAGIGVFSRCFVPRTLAKPLILVGEVITILGLGLFVGNTFGFFRTIPFAGYITIGVGGAITWFASAISRGELRQELQSKASKVIEQERTRAFKMETNLNPTQAIVLIIVFSIGLPALVYFLSMN